MDFVGAFSHIVGKCKTSLEDHGHVTLDLTEELADTVVLLFEVAEQSLSAFPPAPDTCIKTCTSRVPPQNPLSSAPRAQFNHD
jgi:hypothetical protein